MDRENNLRKVYDLFVVQQTNYKFTENETCYIIEAEFIKNVKICNDCMLYINNGKLLDKGKLKKGLLSVYDYYVTTKDIWNMFIRFVKYDFELERGVYNIAYRRNQIKWHPEVYPLELTIVYDSETSIAANRLNLEVSKKTTNKELYDMITKFMVQPEPFCLWEIAKTINLKREIPYDNIVLHALNFKTIQLELLSLKIGNLNL